MGLRDLFRRAPKICAPHELALFVDRHAAFVVQKGIFEYSRARAGHFAKVMFNEQEFLRAVEVSRWRAYPLGLAMVGEVVEGVLRPHYRSERGDELAALSELVLSVFDRYPEPPLLAEGEWAAARADLARRLGLIGLHPVKRVIDIPEPLAKAYFDLMPIHERLRGRDFPTMLNYLKIVLCNVHDELTSRLDAPALVDALLDTGPV